MNKDCVSLDVARKLKAAGWEQNDDDHYLMYAKRHYAPCKGKSPETCQCTFDLICDQESCDYDGCCNHDRTSALAAPTIGELLEALPKHYRNLTESRFVMIWNWLQNKWHVGYQMMGEFTDYFDGTEHLDVAPADALALLWLELKAKNLL